MKTTLPATSRNIIYHVACWLLYIAYEQFYIIFIYHIPTSVTGYLFFYACNILLFYLHFHILNKTFCRAQPRYAFLLSGVIAEMALVLAAKASWEYFSLMRSTPAGKFNSRFMEAAGLDIYRNVYYLFVSTVLWSAINLGRFRRNAAEALVKKTLADQANTELKYQFATAQNAFLKQQINPHLLFNTLNAIYSTVYRNSPADSRSVLLLSDIMRYSFEDAGPGGRVPLEHELLQLQNLIDLNSYRFDQAVRLEYKRSGDPEPHQIIPLVLITLAENMFKHGDLRYEPGSLEITIAENGSLDFVSKNVPRLAARPGPGTHIGLNNTRLRLDYAYPGNYTLQQTATDDLFIMELHINLAYGRNDH